MIPASRRRGEPLAVLGLVVGGWIAARVAISSGALLPQGLAEPAAVSLESEAAMTMALAEPVSPLASSLPGLAMSSEAFRAERKGIEAFEVSTPLDAIPLTLPVPAAKPLLVEVAAPMAPLASFESSARPEPDRESRWSADGWLLMRPDGKGGRGLLSTYGASQTGVVVRYHLSPGSPHRAAIYARAAAALNGSRQREAAFGLSARPLPELPVVAAVEMRVTSDRFGNRLRPAAMAYTELPPFEVAPGLHGEAYLQGGYVAGKGATGFIDGQLRLDRKLVDLRGGELRLGGGAWGGAQEHASRLDIGPAVQVVLPLTDDVFARAAVDWRFRIAGNAAPASGPALTLSAGF